MQGVELVRRVIEKVSEEGLGILGLAGSPRPLPPSTLDALRLPNGAPLTPSMREWLAFDASFVEWFDEASLPDPFEEDPSVAEKLPPPRFVQRNVGDIAIAEFGETPQAKPFRALAEQTLPGHSLLLPRGKMSRRVLYLGEVDSLGEYPVLVIDTDGMPYVGVDQPGFDVFLAVAANLLWPPRPVFGAFADDELFAPRMKEHMDKTLGGRTHMRHGDEGFSAEIATVAPEETMLLSPGDDLPEGYVVIETLVTPFSDLPMRLAAKAPPGS